MSHNTWRLIKIVSPSGTQTVFPKKQTLKLYYKSGRLPGPNTSETLYNDAVAVDDNEWLSADVDCDNQSVLVSYDNIPLRRKYWVSLNKATLQATGYVSQIGSKADTLMYYYEPDK